MKRLAIVLGAVALLAAGGYLLYQRYWYYAPGIIGNITNPISANRDITWAPGPAEAPSGERPPNIIVIVADDLGYNDISAFGGGVAGVVQTPNIDAIGRDGVIVDQGYTSNATCSPSRAAIMTGRYPTRFGFEFTSAPQAFARYISHSSEDSMRPAIFHEERVRDVPPRATLGLPPSEVTIAEMLQQQGYHTMLIGKWHLGEVAEMRPEAQGFNESLGVMQGAAMFLPPNDPDAVNARLDFDPIDRFLWANLAYAVDWHGTDGDAHMRPRGYVTDYFADEAVSAIEANRNRPFFLYLSFTAAHTPLQATREDYDALSAIPDHTQRVYGAMIRSLDRGVGRVMQALRDNGIDDNTLVIFVSDNGGAWYTGLRDINAPYRGWKSTFFEGGIRTPYFVRWPGGLPRGARVPGPASHMDIFATAAAVAGAPEQTQVDGVNMLPYLRGEAQPPRTIFWRSGPYRVVRDGDWKLQVSETPDRVWLFNLAEDPTEQHDLSAQQPERVAALRAMIEAQNANSPPPLWPALIEGPVRIDVPLNAPWSEDQEYIYWSN
ncbi:sulfatase-like hydrolase/transferase [Candidatus Viadribacter manganicus]|uniref:Sulfatase n=1 Tax=Candidatus Viadribacter manganicus TaxID=1759059 RepID=A0A1B1AHL5_9PROT|nr:sulfatase-like hydrolase/transferase [Candidatus Viadribacter manganicus]ANP46030.1 sulfatase [Candidatus Viadribacter manganicus]